MPILEPEPQEVAPSILARREQQRSQLQASTAAAADQSPDAEAEIQTLSNKTGLAPSLVRRNLELVRKRAGAADPQTDQLLRDSPKTAQYLSVPSNAAIASDDHQSLSSIEQIFNVPRAAVGEAGSFVGGAIRGAGELLDIGARAISPPGYWPKGEKGPIADLLDQFGADLQFRAQQHIPPPEQQNLVTGLAGTAGQFGAAIGVALAGGVFEDLAMLANAGPLGQLVAAVAAKSAPLLMFASSGAQVKAEEFRRKGIPPGSVTEDLAMLANAGVFGFTGEFGLGAVKMKNVPPSIRGHVLKYFADIGLSGAKQGLAMQWQGALSNLITKIALDPKQEITQGLLQDSAQGFAVGAFARMLLRLSLPMTPPAYREKVKAEAAKEQLKQLGAALKDSRLQKRSPEAMTTFVAHATEGQKRYINPRDIIEYAGEGKLDVAQVADEMLENGSERLAKATEGGEDIVVPVSEYAARIANGDHDAFFQAHSREDPNAMSTKELTEVSAETEATPEERQQQETIQANLEQLQVQAPEIAKAIDQEFAAAPEAATPDYWQGVEDRAWKRLKERGTLTGERLGAGVDPFDILDVGVIATAKIAKGVRNFAAWSREMVDQFGDRVTPYLRDLYVKSVAEVARKKGITPEQMKEGLQSLTVDTLLSQAKGEAGDASLMTAAELAQMTPEEFQKHQALANKVDDQRRARLASAIRKSVDRERTADRAVIEAEVRPPIEGQHDYQALTALKTGVMPDGSPIPKLDTAALKQMYGEFSKSPERQALKKFGLYRDEGGVHPDIAAEKLGYQSGDELVQALIALPPMEKAIQAAVDAQLQQRYPDMIASGEALREARDLVHKVGLAEMIEADMRRLAARIRDATKAQLSAVTQRPSVLAVREARKSAEAEIAAMRVRDITPGLYSAAAKREAKNAMETFAAGDLQAALAAKQRQLVSVERYRAASNARVEAEKIADNQRSYDRPAKRARIAKSGQYYLDRIDAYREGAEFARVTNKSLDKQASLAQFIQRELDKGQTVDADTLNAVQEGKSYRDMTLAELRQLDAAVEHVDHLSKLKTDLMTSTAERDFDEKRDEMVASVVESQPRVRKDARIKGTDATLAYEAMRKFHRWNAAHRAASSLAFELDGFREGPFRRSLIHPGTDAGLRQTQLLNEFVERITPLFDPVTALGGMNGRGVFFPSINRSLNRTKRIVLALQMGTETGRQRLFGGDGWTLEQVQPVLDSLSPVELKLVQGIFDHFETYRKEAGELERRTTGNEVEWLEPIPIVTKNGTIPGGYYPVKFDLERSTKAQRQADAAAAQNQLQGAYTGMTTQQTYLKSRVPEVYDRPIDLASFRGLWEGTNEVIHDLAFRPFLIDANRIIRDPKIEAAIRDRKGAEGIKVFTSWLDDTAKGDAQAQTIIDHAINYTVRGVTTATLAYRLASGLKQLPDLAFTASRVGKGWVARAVMQSLSAPKETYAFVMEDPLMQERGAGSMLQRDLESIRKQVQGEGPVKRAIYGSFFIFNRVFQQMVDIPSYLAQYNKSFAEHGDEAQARREARQTVMDTQGSSEKQNLPQVMRSRTLRVFTLFYHGFAIQHQAVAERTQRGLRVFQREGVSTKSAAEALSLATDYLMIYGAQAAMGAALKHWFYNSDEEAWAKTLIREGLQGLLGEQIFLREGEGVAEKALGLEEYKRDYQGPAAFRFFVALEKLADQADQGEWDKAYRHAVVNGLAMASGGRIPGSQTNATLDAIIALMEGETSNPLTLITGPPQE